MALTPKTTEEKILITGGRGFIGSHITRSLEKTGVPYLLFNGNLLDIDSVKNIFKTNTVKQVIHLAGGFEGSFEQLLHKNVVPTQCLLEVGTEFGLEKIIYASTGAVYGEPVKEASFESDICKPNTLYGLSKKMAEDVILHYQIRKGINHVILRFPNVYGEGNQKGVLYNFLTAIQTKGSLTIAGDGTQSRNFLHVSDACKAIIAALHYDKSDIFNISNPIKTSINDAVELLKKYFSFEISYVQQDNFLKDLLLDTSKAEQFLGFKAAVNDFSSYIENFNYLATK